MLIDIRLWQQVMLTLVILVVVMIQLNRQQVDRIDYSNDTATASLKGPLTVLTRSLQHQVPEQMQYHQRTWYLRSTSSIWFF